MNVMHLIAVFIGGGLGSTARFGMSVLFKQLGASTLPLATLASNIVSTAILGLIMVKFSNSLNSVAYMLLAVGFCGGFSTFSTFSLETVQLIKNGHAMYALLNVVISLGACLIILFALTKSLK